MNGNQQSGLDAFVLLLLRLVLHIAPVAYGVFVVTSRAFITLGLGDGEYATETGMIAAATVGWHLLFRLFTDDN